MSRCSQCGQNAVYHIDTAVDHAFRGGVMPKMSKASRVSAYNDVSQLITAALSPIQTALLLSPEGVLHSDRGVIAQVGADLQRMRLLLDSLRNDEINNR